MVRVPPSGSRIRRRSAGGLLAGCAGTVSLAIAGVVRLGHPVSRSDLHGFPFSWIWWLLLPLGLMLTATLVPALRLRLPRTSRRLLALLLGAVAGYVFSIDFATPTLFSSGPSGVVERAALCAGASAMAVLAAHIWDTHAVKDY